MSDVALHLMQLDDVGVLEHPTSSPTTGVPRSSKNSPPVGRYSNPVLRDLYQMQLDDVDFGGTGVPRS